MNLKRRNLWALCCLGGLLIASAVMSYMQLDDARSHARRAHMQLVAVSQSIQEIEGLDGKPELASVDAQRSAQLSRHVETVAAQVGIAANQIERVQTQPPRRIDGGPYLRQPTQVLLKQVTLHELIALLHDLDAEGQTLQLDDLRLIAPHDQLVGDRWRAEFTLSYLVYQPLEAQDAGTP